MTNNRKKIKVKIKFSIVQSGNISTLAALQNNVPSHVLT